MPRLLSVGFAVVLAVWLAARLVFFNGYYTEDAPGYVSDAIAIASGEFTARHHVNGLNLGTYGPVAVPLLLGKTEAALSVWPLLCSLLGMLSLALIAMRLLGWRWGLLAAVLYATYPGDVYFSTVVMPDAIQSGWLSVSLLLVTWSSAPRSSPVFDLRRQAAAIQPRESDLRPGSLAVLAAAGVAMGVCHLIRANGVLLLPIGLAVIAVLTRVSGGPWRDSVRVVALRSLTFGAGWLAVFALEGLAYLWAVGDFLFRFHIVDRHYGTSASIAQWGLNTHPLTIPYSLFAPLTWHRFGGWGTFNPDQAYHGLLFAWATVAWCGGALALAGPWLAPRRRAAALALAHGAVWLAWPLLYHQFGSQSLTQYIPIHRLSRHLVVYAPGAIIAGLLGCAVLWHAAASRRARASLAVIGVAVLGLHLALNLHATEVAYDNYHRIKDTYTRIRDRLPATTTRIVADPGDLGFFDFWLNPVGTPRVNLEAFANYARCAALDDSIVLTYSNPGWERLAAPAIRETVERLPCLIDPPAHWRLLYDGYPERVFVVPSTRR